MVSFSTAQTEINSWEKLVKTVEKFFISGRFLQMLMKKELIRTKYFGNITHRSPLRSQLSIFGSITNFSKHGNICLNFMTKFSCSKPSPCPFLKQTSLISFFGMCSRNTFMFSMGPFIYYTQPPFFNQPQHFHEFFQRLFFFFLYVLKISHYSMKISSKCNVEK